MFIILTPEGTASTLSDTTSINIIISKAQDYLRKGDWSNGRSEASKALEDLGSVDNHPIHYESVIYMIFGDCDFEERYYHQAKNFYQKAVDLLEGAMYARSLYRADALNKLGNYWREIKDFQRATPFFNEALEIRRSVLGEDALLVSDVYNNLGINYLYLGDFQKAMDLQLEAMRIRLLHVREPHDLLGQTYNNLGQCYQDAGDLNLALQTYQRALENYPDILKSASLRADVLLNLGTTYDDLGDLDRAIRYFNEALSIYLKTDNLAAASICYNNLGNIWIQKDLPDKALGFQFKALQASQSLYGEVHPDVAQSWYNLGLTYRIDDQIDKAIDAFNSCFAALDFRPDADQKLDRINAFQTLIFTLYNMADMHYIKYLLSDDASHLQNALLQFEYADETLDYLRLRYESLGSKLNLVNNGHIIYEAAMNVLMELHRKTGEARYWHRAFKYAEKSKGLLLLDALQKSKADAFGDVPEEVLATMSALEREIADLEKQKHLTKQKHNDQQGATDSLDKELFSEKQKFSDYLREVNQKYPRYYELRYNPMIPSVPMIQQNILEPGQTLIEYFLGSDLLIFIVNQDEFQVVSVPLVSEFDYLLDTFGATIRHLHSVSSTHLMDNFQTYVQVAIQLYQYLLKPAERYLQKHLIIVPDERLGYLPFDALLTGPVDSLHRFADHPYLIKSHYISYNYSASLLGEMKTGRSNSKVVKYLGFAPQFTGQNSPEGLTELLFNRDEIEEARSKLGGRIYQGDQATKANFIKQQSKYGIIHLATHGNVDPNSEDFSFLAFSQNAYQDPDDFLLYVREIYNLPVHAQLVILSACETGTGKLYQGEGVASIARSFSYAGARSLVATRWNVNDRTTNELIGLFLEGIKEQKPKDEAMQEAIVQYIGKQNDYYAHPFFWSSFMVIGDMRPVKFGTSLVFIGVAVGLLLLLLGGFVYWRLKRV
ncbi:MAG: CHAT domain-containing protein [Saprospiraceae bacterium]|nr:CHAT domain-containing protein [Saprospiraceae bacterium]